MNTRLAMTLAVVDSGTLRIDAYHDTPPYDTGDKALFEGHYYNDKLVGTSLLGVPFYALGKALAGGDLGYHGALYWAKAGAAALPGAGAAVLLFWLLVALGAPPRRAVGVVAAGVAGTMWVGYGALFMPHVASYACLLGALWVIFFPWARRVTVGNSLGVGCLLGGALLLEPTNGLAVFGLGVIWLARVADQSGLIGQRAFAQMAGERTPLRGTVIFAAAFWAGVVLLLAPFAWYVLTVFGRLTMPYQYEASPLFREGMSEGLFGIARFNPAVLWYVTFHPYRGLFFWSPLLLAGVVGCALATRQYGKRLYVGWLGLGCLGAYLLFNGFYYMWWGGWCMGPRFLLPAVPFLLLGLGELIRDDRLSAFAGHESTGRAVRWAVLLAAVGSVALTLPVALGDPQTPQGNPTAELVDIRIGTALAVPQFEYLRAFYSGSISIWPGHRLGGYVATEDRWLNLLGLLLYLGGAGALLAGAWRYAPEKLAGTERHDFPLKTIDGTAAPLPPGGRF